MIHSQRWLSPMFFMTHSLLSRSVISFIALAPLALVSTASAGFTNRVASSGEMQMNGYYDRIYMGTTETLLSTASGTLPTNWLETDLSFYLQEGAYDQGERPRLVFNRWLDTGVSAWSEGGSHTWGDPTYPISWTVPSLEMNFMVSTNDVIMFKTQRIQELSSFTANFQYEESAGVWITVVDPVFGTGAWSNLDPYHTRLFTVLAGKNYRFLLTASAVNAPNDSIFEMNLASGTVPAPGALALLGMAGIFGGRRRR